MNTHPKLTITIPSYRQPKELRRALVALSHQTFKDFEVVVIDDDSKIDIQAIVDEFKNSLLVRIHHNEKNLGAMRNMEFSINFPCNAQYILSHHEDDFLVSNYLEEAVKILDAQPSVSFVLAAPKWAKRDQDFTLQTIPSTSPTFFEAKDFMVASLSRTPFIFGSVVYRRKFVNGTFELDKYYTLCDKIFLNNILISSSTKAAFIPHNVIYVTDHSLDKKDIRSTEAKDSYLINYFLFYKENLPNTFLTKKLITNGLLFGFLNLPNRSSFLSFIKKARHEKLLTLHAIDLLGIYSLIGIFFGKKIVRPIVAILKN